MHPIRPRFIDQISHTNCGPPSEVRKVHDSPYNVRHTSPRSPVICVYFSRSTIYTKYQYVCVCVCEEGGRVVTSNIHIIQIEEPISGDRHLGASFHTSLLRRNIAYFCSNEELKQISLALDSTSSTHHIISQ